jgi:hypothetical protein
MDRRSVLQGLAIAPLAALVPEGKAKAEPNHYTVPPSEREKWEAEKKVWEERKLFTIDMVVNEAVDYEDLFATAWATTKQRPIPVLERLSKVIRSSTSTPDIMGQATVIFIDHAANVWDEPYEVGIANLFQSPSRTLAVAILCKARDVLVAKAGYPKGTFLTELMENGELTEVLRCLGSIHVQFFYYGPPPYPPDGRIHTFDFDTETWKPRVR